MLKKRVRMLAVLVGCFIGFQVMILVYPLLVRLINLGENAVTLYSFYAFGISIFGLIFYFITPWLINTVMDISAWIEQQLTDISTTDITLGLIGLIIGLLLGQLISIPIYRIPVVGVYIALVLTMVLGYLGIRIILKRKDELPILSVLQKYSKHRHVNKNSGSKILDTSVIIDGRIIDICETGFLEGTLVVSNFVLDELRHIADSSDLLKRNRGRRGLDILNKIQKDMDLPVKIVDKDYDDISEVDSKLVKLAMDMNGKVLTNDFNLNKICELQGVPVLNINDLANALKPIVLPGEEMKVQIVKDGKEFGQGVAYLDDGTMIVVEGGKRYISEYIYVVVTSVLQTSAGRMIFAKPKEIAAASEGGSR